MLRAADLALYQGKTSATICEFGVAKGAGLVNMIELARSIGKEVGVSFRIVGFDTGAGIPKVEGFKDHPELWNQGDFWMDNKEALLSAIGSSAEIVFGDIEDTIDNFVVTLDKESPLGFISIDVDTYSGSRSALRVFCGAPECYNPAVSIYLDDINGYVSNRWAGELAAIHEFSSSQDMRRIDRDRTLPGTRPTGYMPWHDKMFACHIFDHPLRSRVHERGPTSLEDAFKLITPLL
jgi:hypothetical protein